MQALDVQWDEGALQLETAMLKKEQVDCPVMHRFGPGIYIREVHLPAGALVIGHHQNTRHTNLVLRGKVKMLNADGTSRIVEAPHFEVMEPGRKVGVVIEDIVWQNIYATEETDIEALELMYLTKSPAYTEGMAGYEELVRDVDRDDFLDACTELDVTPEQVREESERADDLIGMPSSYGVQTGRSVIEGTGLFATSPLRQGEVIAPARLAGKRTIAGRYTNHAKAPNATAVLYSNGDIAFVAIQDISGNRGGSLGDEITVDYRQVLAINEVQP